MSLSDIDCSTNLGKLDNFLNIRQFFLIKQNKPSYKGKGGTTVVHKVLRNVKNMNWWSHNFHNRTIWKFLSTSYIRENRQNCQSKFHLSKWKLIDTYSSKHLEYKIWKISLIESSMELQFTASHRKLKWSPRTFAQLNVLIYLFHVVTNSGTYHYYSWD